MPRFDPIQSTSAPEKDQVHAYQLYDARYEQAAKTVQTIESATDSVRKFLQQTAHVKMTEDLSRLELKATQDFYTITNTIGTHHPEFPNIPKTFAQGLDEEINAIARETPKGLLPVFHQKAASLKNGMQHKLLQYQQQSLAQAAGVSYNNIISNLSEILSHDATDESLAKAQQTAEEILESLPTDATNRMLLQEKMHHTLAQQQVHVLALKNPALILDWVRSHWGQKGGTAETISLEEVQKKKVAGPCAGWESLKPSDKFKLINKKLLWERWRRSRARMLLVPKLLWMRPKL